MKRLEDYKLREMMDDIANSVEDALDVSQQELSCDDIIDFDNGGCFGVDNMKVWQDEYFDVAEQIREVIDEVEDKIYDLDEDKERSQDELDNVIKLITDKLIEITGVKDIDFVSYHTVKTYSDIKFYLNSWEFDFVNYATDKAIKEVAKGNGGY